MHRILRGHQGIPSIYYTALSVCILYTYIPMRTYAINLYYIYILIQVYAYTIYYSTVMTFIVEALDIALVALSVPTSMTTSPLAQ